MIRITSCLFCCALAFAACTTDSTPLSLNQVVGTTGGSVIAPDGTQLAFPVGALPTQTTITVTQNANAPKPANATTVATVYTFGPEGATFAQPVTVTIPFDPSKIPAGKTAADIRIYTAPSGSGNYTTLATTLLDVVHVSATTTHFSDFVAAVATGGDTTQHLDGGTGVVDLAKSDALDLGGVIDLAVADLKHDAATDMPAAGCTVTCTSTGSGAGATCGCTATCSGKMYVLGCTQSSAAGPANCYCEVDSQTMGAATLDTCGPPQPFNAYQTQCGFPGSQPN